MRHHPSRARMTAGLIVVLSGTLAAAALTTTAIGASRPASVAASCKAGFKPAIIGGQFTCLHVGLRCKGRYEKAYRKYRFTCAYGHLHRWSPPPPPVEPVPPQPPPAPPALPGHYKGLTSQNETFEFDVTAGGQAFKGLKTGQINEGCTPPAHIYGNYFDWPDYSVPIQTGGAFAINVPFGSSVGVYPSVNRIIIDGQMTGTVGVGSIQLTTYFTANGVPYECGSGRQTWTVTRTG
jgi:hypothetical protein